MPFILITVVIGCFATAAPASIILESIGGVSGGLEPYQAYGPWFSDYSAADSGYEYIAIPSLGMYNALSWDFREDGAVIRSEMSGGGNPNNVAWVDGSWHFRVEGSPVSYTIEASADLLNSRFMESVPGGHICLSPGCEADWLFAGTSSGTLLPGHHYTLELHPGLWDSSSFRFQVPEPSTPALLGIGLLSLVIGLQPIATKK